MSWFSPLLDLVRAPPEETRNNPEDEMPYTYPSNNPDDYVFFWKITETHGWASQWYNSPFRAQVDIRIEPSSRSSHTKPIHIQSSGEHLFPTAEHWMMACKALLFDDQAIFTQIVSTTGTSPDTMKTIKSLGRKVSNFNEELWVAARYQIVVEGNLGKFQENKELREKLLATEERWIVEASPMDRIWGVGFGEKRALSVKKSWGLNLLGRALMDVRRKLKEEEPDVQGENRRDQF
ncbi:hypothetical protein QCA50_016885 [Cerrena zonata]|uniref:NADAR domain-containing protein n=1 Tax=Cerrena zonata TaxID=2478898 RepID=A0AAW0FLV6_9APHY